jgi:hypothetical protein
VGPSSGLEPSVSRDDLHGWPGDAAVDRSPSSVWDRLLAATEVDRGVVSRREKNCTRLVFFPASTIMEGTVRSFLIEAGSVDDG